MYAKSKKDNCYDVAMQVENIVNDYDINSFDIEMNDIKIITEDLGAF